MFKLEFGTSGHFSYYRLGGLNTDICFSQYWRLEVQYQGARMVKLLVRALPGLLLHMTEIELDREIDRNRDR